ncbi:MAG: hypothetical protein KJP00_16030 [Bacteroidia bacterium]|nr:hypothetical protein [Bacteroidia bacterium]
MKIGYVISILSLGILLQHCKMSNDKVVIPSEPYEKLSDYNFFAGSMANLQPKNGVLPYDLNSPLFTDYAKKARFVWMPEGTNARYTTDHVLDFPKDAVLIKNFYYENDERDPSLGRKIIETRVLVNRGDEWDAYGYLWNEDQSDAYYDVVGDILDVSWVDIEGKKQNIEYIVPNKNQCKGCHAYDNKQKPIGPKVRNLNKDFDYSDGTMNQLDKWAAKGYLNGYDVRALHPSVAVWNEEASFSLHDRAMAYLDINCGHCHNPKGAGNTSGLHLLAESELGTSLGVYKATVSAGAGTGGFTFSIVPGQPEESIMIYRMKSLNPGAMMPELGRSVVHSEGVDLIAQWIRDMDPGEFNDISELRLN